MMAKPTAEDHDLLYAVDEAQHLLFAPRTIVVDVLTTRERLPRCRTFRQAREAIPERYYKKLVEETVAEADQPPSDDHVLYSDSAMQFGEWPELRHCEMEQWLPLELFEEFGERFETMMSSGWNLPELDDQLHDRGVEILEWLRERGYSCEEDDRLPELFRGME